MKEEFLITRQGKQFVLFAGLLDEAHSRGLKKLETEQIELERDGAEPIFAQFKATAEGEDGKTFTGYGDASPETTNRNITPHLIRMAETRAKARALRDFCNIGATSLEELGGRAEEFGEGHSSAPTHSPSKAPKRPSKTRQDVSGTDTTPVPPEAIQGEDGALRATREQIHTLTNLMGIRAKQTEESAKEIRDGFEEYIGFPIKDLSRGEADKYIRSFEKKIEEQETWEES